jgi:protein SCO1
VRWLLFLALSALPAGAKHYAVQGIVIQTDPAARTMLVSHRPIEGYMPAMAMTFRVAPGEKMSALVPGARVRFDLEVGKRESVARRVRVIETRLDFKIPEAPNKVAIGAEVPDFSLVDQANRPVRLSQFRGRVVAVDFIYTRCPLPDVCPRLSANFAYLARRVPDLQLLSITVDPQFDTPAVLAEYGRRYGAPAESWRFLTGTGEQIRSVAGLFGLVYFAEEGSITHTSATAMIDREGRLAALVSGSDTRPDQLRDLAEHILKEK